MSQNQTSYSSKEKERDFEKESNIAIKNLWIGELEQWMDSNYLIEACHSYSKSINFFKKNFFYRRSNKNSQDNPRQKNRLFHGIRLLNI